MTNEQVILANESKKLSQPVAQGMVVFLAQTVKMMAENGRPHEDIAKFVGTQNLLSLMQASNQIGALIEKELGVKPEAQKEQPTGQRDSKEFALILNEVVKHSGMDAEGLRMVLVSLIAAVRNAVREGREEEILQFTEHQEFKNILAQARAKLQRQF